MINENKDHGRTSLLIAVLGTIFFFLLGCAGGKGFRMEIETGNDSNQRIQDLAENQTESELPAKDLPEMTADEYELLGDALLSKKNLYLAYVQYDKSLEMNPGNLRVEYKKGLALLFGQKNDDAIKQFQIVVDKNPNYAPAYEGIGRAYFQKGEYSESEKNFLRAVILDPRLWKSYNYLGYIRDYRKDYKSAIHEYKSALQIKPEKGFIHNNLGVSYSRAGNCKKAVAAFNKAIELNYREGKVYNNMALALANLDRYEEALDAFAKAGGKAQAYNNMGCIYLGRGMFEEAVISFEKAIELEPGYYAKAGDNLKKAKALNSRIK
jgi:tetratricopeptide (TPR) repeat protein